MTFPHVLSLCNTPPKPDRLSVSIGLLILIGLSVWRGRQQVWLLLLITNASVGGAAGCMDADDARRDDDFVACAWCLLLQPSASVLPPLKPRVLPTDSKECTAPYEDRSSSVACHVARQSRGTWQASSGAAILSTSAHSRRVVPLTPGLPSEPCTAVLAGALYFDTDTSAFVGCDGRCP